MEIFPNLALHSLLNYIRQEQKVFDLAVDGLSELSEVSHSEILNWSESKFEVSIVDTYIVELVFELVANITNDVCIGIECSKVTRSHGLESYLLALMSAKNMGDAINTVILKYSTEVAGELFIVVEEDGSSAMSISFGSNVQERNYEYIIDFCLSVLIRLARRLPAHVNASPNNLALKRHCPEEDVLRFEAFYQCPVLFSSEGNFLELGSDFISIRSELAGGINPNFTDFLIKKASVKKGKAFYQKTQLAIENQLTEGKVNIDTIASMLNVSPRTMQNRLASEGESFRSLYEKARHRRALYFLTQTKKSILQISDALEYTSEASFIRAFRRWEGASPAAFRKKYFS